MNSMAKQRGLATVLLVLLVGVTVMVITGVVAKNVASQKEATVAAHAQTNAQMMGWAGVSAFQQILVAKGQQGVAAISSLNGTSLTLKDTDTQKIVANHITVTSVKSDGTASPTEQICANNGDTCTVSADISAEAKAAKAASTINVVFEMKVKDGTVAFTKQESTINFGGNTTLSGNVEIAAETPDAKVTLNTDGNFNVLSQGLITKNISVLNINSTKDVYIDCNITNCGSAIINVTARNVIINDGTNFGTIKASGNVWVNTPLQQSFGSISLGMATVAKDITAGGNVVVGSNKATVGKIIAGGTVDLSGVGSSAKNIAAVGNVKLLAGTQVNGPIESQGNVTVSGAKVFGDINANGTVTVNVKANVQGNIVSNGAVSLSDSQINGDVSSAKDILVSKSTVGTVVGTGNVKAYDFVEINVNSTIQGSVYAQGNKKYNNDVAVSHSDSIVQGNIYANKDLYIWGLGQINSKVFLTGYVRGVSDYVMKAGVNERMTSIPQLNFQVIPSFTTLSTFDFNTIQTEVTKATTFNNHIDVKAYLNEANYIFLTANTNSNSITGVFLNKVKSNNITYMADCVSTTTPISCTQSQIDANGNKTTINTTGFKLADYKFNGNTYTGALCLNVDANSQCSQNIVGYIPRISVGYTVGVNDAYGYGYITGRWRLRSLAASSNINNAVLAPGVMFFDGDLEFAGDANWRSDSTTNAYVNSFLATGMIWDIAFSPTIYSPYSVVNNGGTVGLVCDKTLQDTNMAPQLPAGSLSSKYPMPINLCSSATTFAKNMNKDSTGTITNVTIDNAPVPKLDLGNVALMANVDINIGSCGRIFGDVLARGQVITSAACGITNTVNSINGQISTQGQGSNQATKNIGNTIMGGTKIKLPNYGNSENSGTLVSQVIEPTTFKMLWSKTL